MTNMILEIPDGLAEALKIPPDEQIQRLYQELAVRLYQKGILTFGRARELAGATKWKFHNLLGEENIERRYDTEELEFDLKSLESIS